MGAMAGKAGDPRTNVEQDSTTGGRAAPPRRRRRSASGLLMAGVAIGAAALLAGCAPRSAPVATPSPEPTVTVTASVTPTQNGPRPTPTGQTSTPTHAAAAACTPATTSLALTDDNAGAGTVFYRLQVTNTGSAPCTLTGYPGVSMVDDAGTQIGAPADREPGTSSTVTLAPGQSSYAPLAVSQAGNYGSGCTVTPASALRVYLPDRKDSATTPAQLQGCSETSIVLMKVKPFGAH